MLTFEAKDRGVHPQREPLYVYYPLKNIFFNKSKKQETTERGEEIEGKNKDRL